MILNEFVILVLGFTVLMSAIYSGAILRAIFKKPVQWTDLPVPGSKKKRRSVRKYNPDLKGRG